MGSNPVVFYISSDEEEVTSDLEEPKGDDYDWFSEVLKAVNKGFDDSDEVVVVGEVNPNKKSKSRNLSVEKDFNVEDDDCIVLEGDPEKVVSDVNDNHEDSDELLVVGQKGQIACRDFPHPRHDCAKFPFSSNSHEQHCELCHCFVCDMRAPCFYWGSGISNTDHCHATDKEEIWKTLRKNFRLGRNVSAHPVTSHSTVVPQLNQAPRQDIIRLTTQNHVSRPTPTVISPSTVVPFQASGSCIPQNHVSRPSTIRACSSSTRHGIPYNTSVGGRHVRNKSMVQSRSVSQEVLGVRNTVIRRDRGIKIGNLSSQFVSSNTMSKRLDTEVSSTVYHAPYVPSEDISSVRASRYQQNPASVTTSNEGNTNPIDWPKNCSNTSLETYTHQISSRPSTDCVFMNSAPSLSSGNNWHVPQSNVHEDINQVQNRNRLATHDGFSGLDISWVEDIGQSNQQPPADYLQHTSGTTMGEEPFKVNEGDNSYYNELESILLDSHCTPEGSLNAPSPLGHISFDTGMLFFDIENAWDHQTRA
ncbi:RPM1 interacting protein 13, putative isoform 2 [Hibiscus syriacus]|uniref:RPM1 interacting protein 13, putative isoform 2 n=1 Tax=Hibiscus syriacus TaxID=106335 RepID=A0A6A2WM22_HIBSY|nr:RPM1 interacting protein 13, putative isoform 2 [Hibiscus syriacus]